MIDLMECVDLPKLRAALAERRVPPFDDLEQRVAKALMALTVGLRFTVDTNKVLKIKNTAELSQTRKELFQDPAASSALPGWTVSIAKTKDHMLGGAIFEGLMVRGWSEKYFKPKKLTDGVVLPDPLLRKIAETMNGDIWEPFDQDNRISFDTIVKTFPRHIEDRLDGSREYLVFSVRDLPPREQDRISVRRKPVHRKNVVSVPTYAFSRNLLLFERKGFVRVAKCDGLLVWNKLFFLWMEAA